MEQTPKYKKLESSYGKIPPQATDLEEVVLGALMLDKEAMDKVADILVPEAFYTEAHQHIYNAIRILHSEHAPIDILTVTKKLQFLGKLDIVGGAYVIATLTSNISSAAHIEYHARIIMQKFMGRELIRIANETSESAYDDTVDVFDLVDKTESQIKKLSEQTNSNTSVTMIECVMEFLNHVEVYKNSGLTGVPTGLSELDRHTRGWQPTDLIIIGGEPSQGKTSLALLTCEAASICNLQGLIISLEMTKVQLTGRLIAMRAGVSSKEIYAESLTVDEKKKVNRAVDEVRKYPLYIDGECNGDIRSIVASIRTHVKKYDIKYAILDYLQLTRNGGIKTDSRTAIIGGNALMLKLLAKELNIPIIAVSSLSRNPNHTPSIFRLKESGDIEFHADNILFPYRIEEYQDMEQTYANGMSADGNAMILFEKGRNIGTTRFPAKYTKRCTKFSDYNEQEITF